MLRRIVHRLAKIKVIDICPANSTPTIWEARWTTSLCNSCFWIEISDRHNAYPEFKSQTPADSDLNLEQSLWRRCISGFP